MPETAVEEKNNQVIDVGKQDISKQLEQKKQVIRNTLAKDANKGEFEMFMHLAKTYQLDPFQKEIFFWKYSGDTTIMTSRDGYLKIANRHPEFNGMDSGVIYPGDTFEKKKDGVKHELNVENLNKRPVGAYAVVYRNDREQPTIVVVPFNDYNKDSKVWNNYPTAMIQKVAESMALKRAFSVSGLVSKEEMETEQTPDYDNPYNNYNNAPTKDVTPDKGNNTSNSNNTQNTGDMTLEEAKNMKAKGKKFKGKQLKDCPEGYLEWMAENWNGDKLRKAAKKVYIWKSKQEDEEQGMSERQKEIGDIVDGDEELRNMVVEFKKEENCKDINNLSVDKFTELKQSLESIKEAQNKSGEDVADEVDRELEEDEFDTPF